MSSGRSWRAARRGFTLVEVALTVAVGLIILGGAVTGYQAVKDNASSAFARKKVNMGAGVAVEYSAVNFGRFPTSVAGATGGEFSRMWIRRFPDEYNVSPWGGQTSDTTDGCSEVAEITDAGASEAAATDKTAMLATDQAQAANISYVSIQGNGYVSVLQLSNPTAKIGRNFIIGIYDRVGQPWFHVVTNK